MPSLVSRVPVQLFKHASEAICEAGFDNPHAALPELCREAGAEQVLAASQRLRAFINLMSSGVEVPFWIKRTANGSAVVNEALFNAAAVAKLPANHTDNPDKLVFDLRELMDCAIKLVEPVGHA